MIEIARSFLRTDQHKQKNVFISIDAVHNILVSQLGRRLTEEGLQESVTIDDISSVADKPEFIAKHDLILVDETHMMSPYELEGVTPEQSLIMFSSKDGIHLSDDFQVSKYLRRYSLTKSLRSTRKLTEFVKQFQIMRNIQDLVVEPGLAIAGSNPDIVKISNPWDRNEIFLMEISKKLKGETCMLLLSVMLMLNVFQRNTVQHFWVVCV